MSLLNLQGQLMAGIKRKGSVVLCTEAESSASEVQNMKVLWKLLLTAKYNGDFFLLLCFVHFFLAAVQPLYGDILCLQTSLKPPFIHGWLWACVICYRGGLAIDDLVACSCIRSQLLIHAVANGGVSQGLKKRAYTVGLVKRQVD